ncbi:MAG: ABC transporter permease [Acidimicrobiia bacterium]|nr:ABC transporter permease [Acidimicrobiia bacterium]
MAQFALRRVLQLILVFFVVTFVAFASLKLVGDPLFNLVGVISGITEEQCEAVARGELEDTFTSGGNIGDCALIQRAKAENHLDKGVPQRYGIWVINMFRGDFGTSFVNGDEISDIIADRLPVSVRLIVLAQLIALGIAVPWGVAAAYRANRGFDKVSTVGSFALLSVPNFALGVILLYFFSLRWQIFPSRYENHGWWSEFKALILPAATLALGLAATYQRLLRTDLITTLQEDFVHMARAKGLSDRHIMYRHALRPSLFSVVTVFGVNTGALIGGALVVEQIYSIPGVGTELVEAVLRNDPPVVVALIAVVAVGFVLVNFLVDLVYAYLDPRVRSA